MSGPPRVLVATSAGAPEAAVTPVLAAVQAVGLHLRAIDLGRAGDRGRGAALRVLKAVVGELAERRLLRELAANPPDVTVAFDPDTTAALCLARDEAERPAPVVAVVAELAPDAAWANTDADRYLAVDDEAAVALADAGVAGERMLVVGPIGERAFAEAGAQARAEIRRAFKLPASGPVVLVEVAGLGGEVASQVALQLSLAKARATYLFDAGDDGDAAAALRHEVPTLEMRAKLFGVTPDAPRLWRAADAVVARPRSRAVARALVVGARAVAFRSDGAGHQALVSALEERGIGVGADNALLLAPALDPLLALPPRSDARIGADGAANVADAVWLVGQDRRDIVGAQVRARAAATRARVSAAADAAEAAARANAAPGALEDLSGAPADAGQAPPEADEVADLLADVRVRMERGRDAVVASRRAADQFDARAKEARERGDQAAAREAEKGADAERRRMHAALSQLAELEAEANRLKRASARVPRGDGRRRGRAGSDAGAAARAEGRAAARGEPSPARKRSVDEVLAELKRKQGSAAGAGTGTVDDELEALKRKMRK